MTRKERIFNLLAQLQENSQPPATLEAEFRQEARIREIRQVRGAKDRIAMLVEDLKG